MTCLRGSDSRLLPQVLELKTWEPAAYCKHGACLQSATYHEYCCQPAFIPDIHRKLSFWLIFNLPVE